MSDNTWVCQLTLEMCKQLPNYNGTPLEKVHGEGSPRRRGGGKGAQEELLQEEVQEDTLPAVLWARPSILSADSVSCSLRLSGGCCGPGRTGAEGCGLAAGDAALHTHLLLLRHCAERAWPLQWHAVCLARGAGTECPTASIPPLGAGTTPCLASLQNFLYKCVGTTLGAASSKEVVRKHLQELLETARYQEEREREVAAPQPLRVCACPPPHLAQV